MSTMDDEILIKDLRCIVTHLLVYGIPYRPIHEAIRVIETLAMIKKAVTAYFNDDDIGEMELIDALTDWSDKGDTNELKRLAGKQ